MRSYIDSDVLIWHLRGKREALAFFRRVSQEEGADLWIGALQRAEVVFFMRANEIPATMQFLSKFKTAAVTQEIVDEAGILYRKWHASHGIDVNDAVLAATVMRNGGKIFTLNTRHYPMADIAVLSAS
jgi:predicted nucleic acid-binding protein